MQVKILIILSPYKTNFFFHFNLANINLKNESNLRRRMWYDTISNYWIRLSYDVKNYADRGLRMLFSLGG